MINRYLPQLDSLKLISMLLVFSTHCYLMGMTPETKNIYDHYFVFSGIGVEFFIMVSGFFSVYTYKDISVSEYLKKKCYRLFPVHWACLLISSYLVGIRCGKIPYLTPLSMLLLQSLIPISGDTNQPCWTISTLLMLYAVTPFLIKQLRKIPQQYYFVLMVVLSVMSTIINFFLYDPSSKIMFWFLYVSPYYRIITYIIGMLIGMMIIGEKTDIQFWVEKYKTLFEILVVSMFLIIMFVFHRAAGYWYTLPVALLIGVFACDGGWISKILSNKVLLSLSKISFCFYLIHFPILQALQHYLDVLNVTPVFIMIVVLVSLLVSLCASYFLHIFIEKPFSRIRISIQK